MKLIGNEKFQGDLKKIAGGIEDIKKIGLGNVAKGLLGGFGIN